MLDMYRFNDADLEDVKLADPTKYATLDEGEWIHPLGNAADTWAVVTADPSQMDASRVAGMLFMEAGRTDAKAVGKMTIIRGKFIRGRTDVFIAADGAGMTVGKELALKLDTDGRVKLGLAAAGDVVKAVVYRSPANDPTGKLDFQLV